MEPLTLVIGGLAVWRLSHAIVKEDGPSMIFVRLRAYFAKKQKKAGGMFDLISCVACTSFWIGILASLWVAESLLHVFAYGLVFSALSMLLERLTTSQAYINSKNVK